MEVSISELERQIYEKEEVRVVIRGEASEKVEPYPYERKEAENTSVSHWLERRVLPLVGDLEVSVINGQGVQPHGRTQIEKIRSSYKND